MIVRIIKRRWNKESNKLETVDWFNEIFEGTRQQAHRKAREKYPLPEFTLGQIWREE